MIGIAVHLIQDVLVRRGVAGHRRIVDRIAVRDRGRAVERPELAETELLVVAVAQVHVLVERMERDGTVLAVPAVPYLVEGVRLFLVRHELLVRGLHGIVELGQAQAGQRLIFDIRGAATVPRRQHQAGCGAVLDIADIGHRVFGQGDARHSGRVGERLRENHDHRAVGEVVGSRLIRLLRVLGVFGGQFLHGALAVSLRLVHGLGMRKTHEVHSRAVVPGIAERIPQLGRIAHPLRPLVRPGAGVAKAPRKGEQHDRAQYQREDARAVAHDGLDVPERTTPVERHDIVAVIKKL